MNDEFPRRQADEPDLQPDFGFGGVPLFRDEVPPAGEAGFGAVGPGSAGFHDASPFRAGSEWAPEDVRGLEYGAGGDYGTGILSGFAGGAGLLSGAGGFPAHGAAPGGAHGAAPGGAPGAAPGATHSAGPEWAPNEGPLRVVPADQASALLRIKLPESPPVPATTLRGAAAIEEVVEAAQMLHHVSPAKPNALPGDVLALTTATMVVPLPGAAFGGVRAVQRSARLTASVPPDLASRAEADLLSDTVEQFFGDFDAIGRELDARRAGGVPAGAAAGSRSGAASVPTVPAQGGEAVGAERAGRYGVPTQVPGYDAARRSPVGMRYLGGIFHDSSGESSFYDPSTASLMPMGAAAISASDFRRTAPAITRPVPPPRMSPRTSPRTAPPRETGDETRVLPKEHWSDHHPDHHRHGRRQGRIALVSALSVTLAFGTLYGAALAFEGQVPKGTVVGGVAIGGMSRTAAEARLSAALGPALDAPIRLTADGTTFQLPPDRAGLDIDYAGTIAAAAAGRTDPAVAIPALAGSSREVALQVSVDRAVLKTALANLTAGFNKPMVDGSVVFPGGVPTPIAPRPGREVDLDAAVDAVVSAFDGGVASVRVAAMAREESAGSVSMAPAAYAIGGGAFPAPPVVLTVHEVQPTVTPAAVAQAMQDFARPAMSGPVTLNTGSVRTVLKPAILGRHLAIEPDGHGALVPKLDGAGIRAELDHDALAKLEQPATDASFTVSGGKPVLVPGKNGVGYAPPAIQNALLPVLTKTSSAQRVATVPIGPLPPALTTEAAQALGIRDVMGLYTAPFSAATQRTATVKRAADLVRGQIVQPGQTFSLDQVLGAPSAASASAAQDGSGASLVATALFNAEYLAGLKDVEHHPHATVTDHFPPGMEAAVAPNVDLKFQNDSSAPVYLWTSTTDNAVTIAVLGQKMYDSVQTETSPHYALVQPKTTYSSAGSCVANDGVPGFQVDVTRTLTKAGQTPIREVFHSSYAAQDKVVCGTPGTAGSSAAGGAAGTAAGTSAASQNVPTQGATTSSPNAPSGTPTGGATSGTPVETTSSAGSDGSLLGGLLGAPSSHH